MSTKTIIMIVSASTVVVGAAVFAGVKIAKSKKTINLDADYKHVQTNETTETPVDEPKEDETNDDKEE